MCIRDRYGFSFAGSAGFTVPIGAVFIFVAGWFVASGFPGIADKDAGGAAVTADEAPAGAAGEE